ncbi:MAG TPA: RNB domain-containing ribonuclease [Rhodocyclaceae bacterium]|nr:RNB domain-containing ribonuclease [Rhodocyclaceae bacterium]
MNVLFEEDGAFKAGSILADNNTSLQIELPTGKRSKVKSANVLLRFASPNPAELMQRAEKAAEEIDVAFLWEVCGDTEFAFEELAAEYQGDKPGPVESAGVLMRLHSAPMYFHRKGKGRYRKAPPEILQAALAGLEKKRLQAEQVERMSGELMAGTLPPEFAPILQQLLYKPDRNRLETKALEAACAETHLSSPKLLARCGAFASSHDYHLGRFLFEYFAKGTDFPTHEFAPSDYAELPLSPAQAFSIDDAQTTEIDDALSVTPRPQGGWRVGIHIAAPGLAITPETALGAIARERLSTVYMPGHKITMLPDAVVEAYTLAAGRICPTLSLYLDVAADLRVEGQESKLERIHVAANLRHHDIEPVFNDETLAAGDKSGLADFPYRDELFLLWQLATVMEAGRGKPSANRAQKDYNYRIDWERDGVDGKGWVSLDERPRGSPLDMLVAEMMIAANSGWGAALRDAGVAALYRAQSAGKVRMTTVAAPHDGLGVDCYAWASSPLRRYIDLINQWQLIAWLRGETPRYTAKDPEFLAALRDFELTYAAYAEFQRGMERYWCLRWLVQAQSTSVNAVVLRESLVRLEALPLVLRVNSLPALDRGARVELEIGRIDLLDADIHAIYRSTLAEHGEIETAEEDETALIGAEEVTETNALAAEPSPELAGNEGSASALGGGAGEG